jgi:hypothetical protein
MTTLVNRRNAAALFLSATLTALPGGVRAAEPGIAAAQPTPEVKAEARGRFDRGLRLFNEGDNAGALAEFKRAYELIPNALVAYNIGLVCASMGRPVEAVDALDKLLANPGSASPDVLARAQQTRAEQAGRVAELSVVTNVPALVEVDGVEAGRTPLAAPLRVAGGVHVVGAVEPGYAPVRREVTAAGAQRAEVRLDLVEMAGKAAHLALKTHLPSAEVVIDGQAAGKTPLPGSLTIAPGPHTVELRRIGYVSARQDVTLGEGAEGEVTLEPEEDRSAIATGGGDLALDVRESEPVVTVDGKLRGVYRVSFRLAPGVHDLLIERGGFEPMQREVTVDGGRITTIHAALDPTPDTRAAYLSRTASQRTWGILATAGGAVIAGAAAGFLVWNGGQKSSAQNDFNAANANLQNRVGVCDTASAEGDANACNQTFLDAQSKLNDAKGRDVFGYVGVGVGAAAAALGVVLLVTNGSAHEYDRPVASAARPSLLPSLWGDSRGVGVGLAGSL